MYLCLLLTLVNFPQPSNCQSGVLLGNSYTRSGELGSLGCGRCTLTPSQRLGTCVPPVFHVKILPRTFPGARNDFHRIKRVDFRPKSGWERDARGLSPGAPELGRRLIGRPGNILHLDRLKRIGRPIRVPERVEAQTETGVPPST
jgi:hypothetical protein